MGGKCEAKRKGRKAKDPAFSLRDEVFERKQRSSWEASKRARQFGTCRFHHSLMSPLIRVSIVSHYILTVVNGNPQQ